eukprot:1322647-Prymnesium_polylepis.2
MATWREGGKRHQSSAHDRGSATPGLGSQRPIGCRRGRCRSGHERRCKGPRAGGRPCSTRIVLQQPLRAQVPQLDRRVGGARGDAVAVGQEVAGGDEGGVLVERVHARVVVRVPQLDALVVPA